MGVSLLGWGGIQEATHCGHKKRKIPIQFYLTGFKSQFCHLSIVCKKVKVKVTSDSLQLYSPRNSPGQNSGVGSRSLLQGIFPTQGLNPGLPHCRQILYQLSHKGSPSILEWVAYPFSSGSSQPTNRTGFSALDVIFYQLSYQRSPIICIT